MEFVDKIKNVFDEDIEILEFKNEKNPITFKCLKCGTLYNFKCARNLFAKTALCKKCCAPGRWTKEKLQDRLNKIFVNSDVTLIDFNGMRAGGNVRCNKCGEIEHINNFEALLSARKDNFCMNCEKNKNAIYKHLEQELNKNYIKLLEWHGVNNKAKFQCLRCGFIFKKNVTKKFNGQICPNCFKVHNKFTLEEGQKMLDEKGNNEYTLLQFKGTNEKCLIKHKKCGFCFTTRLGDFEKTKGCPKCYKKYSKGEQMVAKFLTDNNYHFTQQKRYADLPKFSFDFCVTLNNQEILIEVQGRQHYQEIEVFDSFEKQQQRDKTKREYCLVHNIPLIEVPYWELQNLNDFLQLKFNDYL